MRWFIPVVLLLTACGGASSDDSVPAADSGADTSAASDACGTLCTDAGFSGGAEVVYGGELFECTCEGSGSGLTQDACNDYCAGYGVDADHSYLSENAAPNDKCVCDGTAGR